MDDLTLSLVVIVGLAVVGFGVFLLVRRNQARRAAQLLDTAAARGWQGERIREGRVDGYRFAGITEGIAWTLETTLTTSPAASHTGAQFSRARHTCWHSMGAALADGLILIGPRAFGGPMPDLNLGGLGGVIVPKAPQLMLGEDAERFPGLRDAPLGSGALRAGKYSASCAFGKTRFLDFCQSIGGSEYLDRAKQTLR